jgi:hypothetical protein
MRPYPDQSSALAAHCAKRSDRGFVGVVFLAIALIVIVTASIATMSRSSASGTADESFKATSSIILKQSADLKDAFDRMIVASNLSASQITFDDQATTGIFNPTSEPRYAIRPMIPSIGLVNTSSVATYSYAKGVRLPGVGADARADYIITAGDLNLKTCQSINRQRYGDVLSAAPAVSTGSLAVWFPAIPGGVATVDDSAITATNYRLRPEGCVQTSDGKYVYYKAVVEDA